MISKEEQKALFKYFAPKFFIKFNDKGIESHYYLVYKNTSDEKNKDVVAMYVIETNNLQRNTTSKKVIDNYFKDLLKVDDLIEYIKTEKAEEYNKMFIEEEHKYRVECQRERTKKFNNDILDISNEATGNEHGQLAENKLVGVEYHFIIRENLVYFSIKVGIDKFYIVKSLARFSNSVDNNETVPYGKQLSFMHSINNFKPEDRDTLLLITQLFRNTYDKETLLNKNSLGLILNSLKGRHIYFNNDLYFVKLNKIDVEIKIDNNYIMRTNLPKDSFLISSTKELFLFDMKNLTIDLINCDINHMEVILFAHRYEDFDLKPNLKQFRENVFYHYQDIITVDETIEKNFKGNLVSIEAYFDYVDSYITLKTKLFKNDEEITPEKLDNYFDKYKYNQYQNYMNNLGFVNNIIKDKDNVYHFFVMDFSFLKKICKVYLSESIASKQVMSFSSPQIRVKYHNNLLGFALEKSQYNDDELYQILRAIRHKQRYFILNQDTIVDLNNQDAINFERLVEDLKLDAKNLSKECEKPLYQSFKLQNYDSNITIDEHVEKIIYDIANFKILEFDIPKVNATLRPYQIEGFKWLKILSNYNLGGILADDMGLGKTLEIITLLQSDDTLMPSIIICPKSLIFNWHSEFEKFAPDAKVIEIYGSQSERNKIINNILPTEKVIYITSYDMLRNDEALQNYKFNYMIIDEGQYIKNINAKKTKSVKEIKAIHKFALTGTPIENNIYDLWSLFDYIMPDYLPELSLFRERASNNEYLQVLAKKVSPFILRRTKQEVLLDLPSKYEHILTCEMTTEQSKIYDAYVLKVRDALNKREAIIAILSAITRLRQICVDPGMFVEDYNGSSGKIELLMELVDEYINGGHKILIFSQFVSALNIVEEKLKDKDITYFKLTGDTKAEDRFDMANNFNNDDNIKVFLISLKAGGTGLNLTGADTIIHLDPWWNVAAENQATDRSHRIGQTKNVEVIKLICRDTIEQRVIQLQNIKKDLIDKLISNDDSSITKLSKEDLDFILS